MPPKSLRNSDSSDSLAGSDNSTSVVKRKRAETIGKSAGRSKQKRNRASTITANSESEVTDTSGVITIDDDDDVDEEIISAGVKLDNLDWVQARLGTFVGYPTLLLLIVLYSC